MARWRVVVRTDVDAWGDMVSHLLYRWAFWHESRMKEAWRELASVKLEEMRHLLPRLGPSGALPEAVGHCIRDTHVAPWTLGSVKQTCRLDGLGVPLACM